MAHTVANQDAVLKDVYNDEEIAKQSFGENPLFAIVKKERAKNIGGRRCIQVVEFAHPNGASAGFEEAMTDGTDSQYEDFILTRKKQYQRIRVDHELLFATEKKSDSLVDAMKEFDRGLMGLGEKVGRRCYRTLGGSMGQLSIASTTTTTLSFTDNAAVFNFMLGQKLQFSTSDGSSGSLLDGGDFTTVTGIDHEAGTVTIADDLATKISGVTTSSYVFTRGDFGQCISGLEDWLPVDNRAARLAAPFNGVIRNPASVYLGGVYMDGTSLGSLDQVLIKLVGKIGKFGGRTSHIFANPESLTDLELVQNSKIRYLGPATVNVKGDSGDILVGFSGYRVRIGSREVTIIGDRNCPSNRVYALQMNTWTMWYTGKLFNWLGEDYTGNRLSMSQNDDSAEARIGSYMQLGCSAPGWNGVAKINPSTSV